MKSALVVNHITRDIECNLAAIINFIILAANAKAKLVLFPEAALTGLINSDEPECDLLLGQPIPGRITDYISKVTQEKRLYIGIGMLEREERRLYDSAILFNPEGEIILKYRRITSGWHGKNADPMVYCHGEDIPVAETSLGKFVFLICGDLFKDELINRVRELKPDYLLHPFARSFEDGSYNQQRWDNEEKIEYIKRARLTGATTLMTNYIADEDVDRCFGGAMAVSPEGNITACLPIGKAGMLLADL